jgi:inorganic triphosphatase YgiF
MNAETELKFRVAPGKLLYALRDGSSSGRRPELSEQALVSTYYDTNKQKLRRHGLTLRVRKIDDCYVQTVKAGGSGSLIRREWDKEVAGAKPNLKKARNTPLERLATKKLTQKLKPLFQTDVHRTAQAKRFRRSKIEVAIDRGRIKARRRTRPIAELELELKSGLVADLFRLARDLERKTAAELDLHSKSERGYRLVSGDGGGAQRAEPIHLKHDLSPRDAFRIIAQSTLRHFSGNADSVRNMDSEGVHQMRVGLRRLRAGISLFADVLPRASTARIKIKLKWLTNELAPAREIDVFLKESVRHMSADRNVPRRGAHAIRNKFAGQRAVAFRRARKAAASARYRRLLIEVMEWIEIARPRTHDGRSIDAYAARLLDKRVRKARKEGKRLTDLDTKQRHKLRIKIKKLRYAVDFFGSLYRERDQKALDNFSNQLKEIQSALGSLNDFIAHRELATDAALTASIADRRAQAFASGFIVGQERKAAEGLMSNASNLLHRLRRLSVEPSS